MATAPSSGTVRVPLRRVKMLSGETIEVQGDGERDFWNNQQKKYMAENTFTNTSDLQDLDRLLFLELLVHRATRWLSAGTNYYGEMLAPSEEADCRKLIKDTSPMISTIKNDLSLTKTQRDREQYESVGTYIIKLKARAREHGVKREKELTKALCLLKELFSVVSTYDRADQFERVKLGLESPEDILEWVRTYAMPEFNRIDEYFRDHDQRYWVRDL